MSNRHRFNAGKTIITYTNTSSHSMWPLPLGRGLLRGSSRAADMHLGPVGHQQGHVSALCPNAAVALRICNEWCYVVFPDIGHICRPRTECVIVSGGSSVDHTQKEEAYGGVALGPFALPRHGVLDTCL